jgi:hypothetical protein
MEILERQVKSSHSKKRDEDGGINGEQHKGCHVCSEVNEATGPGSWCHVMCCETGENRKALCFNAVLQLFLLLKK